MTRLIVIALALAPGLAWADFKLSDWQYRKKIPVRAGAAISALYVDRQVFAKSREDLADLRIVRWTEEVPYAITQMAGTGEVREAPAEVLDRVATSGSVQFVVGLLGETARHSRITLSTSETNFRKKVKIEASPDRKNWSLLRKEAYIFDFTYEAQHASIRWIEYPVSTRRYLRVTVEGWKDPAVLTGATVSLADERPAVRQTVQEFAMPTAVEDTTAKAAAYVLDFGEDGIPKDQLRIEISGSSMFHRAADVEVSNDTQRWTPLSRGVIYRIPDEQSLWLTMPDTRQRYLRVRIFHGDDKPLTVRSITAESLLRRVTFPTVVGSEYWIYYGNTNAQMPVYDLPKVLAPSALTAPTINAGVEEINPAYVAPAGPVKPFSDRYPQLLYAILALAVLAIGYATVRFLQRLSA